MGSMGLVEPINFERRVLEPIIFWGNSLETLILTKNGNKIRYFQFLQKASNPLIQIPDEAPATMYVVARKWIEFKYPLGFCLRPS